MMLGAKQVKAITEHVLKECSADMPPRRAVHVVAEVIVVMNLTTSAALALELAEQVQDQFLNLLRRQVGDLNRTGRFCPIGFSPSSGDIIQGDAYEYPSDSDDTRQAKRQRAQVKRYLSALKNLTPEAFEALCCGVLQKFGVEKPVLTRRSRDEGIDFYGKVSLKSMIFPKDLFSGVHRQLNVWMIGQAKRYLDTVAQTPDIRDLVGSVYLAKGEAYGSAKSPYDLKIRICDPVFYLFFTTGNISSDGWRLLERSGVVGMDGATLAAFLADMQIGLNGETFDEARLTDWISEFRN